MKLFIAGAITFTLPVHGSAGIDIPNRTKLEHRTLPLNNNTGGRALKLIDKFLLVSEIELENSRDEIRVLQEPRSVYAKGSRKID